MSDKEKFAPGVYFDLPREGAPEYVMGGVTIDLVRFLPWAIERAKAEPKLRLDCKKSQEGKGYTQINDWKPKGEGNSGGPARRAPDPRKAEEVEDDIPFVTPFSTF